MFPTSLLTLVHDLVSPKSLILVAVLWINNQVQAHTLQCPYPIQNVASVVLGSHFTTGFTELVH